MADWPFILVLQVVLRHRATTAVLRKHRDTRMPTWFLLPENIPAFVWQANWFVNQVKSCVFYLWTLKCVQVWLGWECAVVFCHKSPHSGGFFPFSFFIPIKRCISKLSKNAFSSGCLFLGGNQWFPAVEGFLCQLWKSKGMLSAPEDVV